MLASSIAVLNVVGPFANVAIIRTIAKTDNIVQF